MRYALLAVLLLTSPALAQQQAPPPCGPTDKMERNLAAKFGETPFMAGLSSDRSPILMFANPKTGTWSVTLRLPNRISCIVQSGEGYTALEPEDVTPGKRL